LPTTIRPRPANSCNFRRIRRTGGRFVAAPGSADVQWLLMLMGVDRELEFVKR
jgi:hypothetical protein